MEWVRGDYVITNEPPANAAEATFDLLAATYWSSSRSPNVVRKILDHSLCFFLMHDRSQIGFGRVITDFATTSWIADVVINDTCRNAGLGTWFMKCLLSHPDIRDTQFALQTGTAHAFYERLGFTASGALMSTPVDYL